MRSCRVACAALLCLVVCRPVSAQTATISGRVVDSQNASVAAAEISLLNPALRRIRATRSSADGSFSLDGIPPGDHVLVVQAAGFAEWTQTVTLDRTPMNINVTLVPAAVVEDVTVQGALLGTAATGKTNLPLRDMPMTVHTVPSSVIREQGANDLVTALQNVPGVYAFTNYGIYEGYTFRGFLDLFPSLANQLVDGVRHEGNRINTQLANIDRVEVLKGPSSALYGGGAIGATVNLIRKKPSAQPAYDFSAGGRKLAAWAAARSAPPGGSVAERCSIASTSAPRRRKATGTTTRGASR